MQKVPQTLTCGHGVDTSIHRQSYRQTDRQTDRQAGKQRGLGCCKISSIARTVSIAQAVLPTKSLSVDRRTQQRTVPDNKGC